MVTQLSILEQYAQDCLEFDSKYCEDKDLIYHAYVRWCDSKNIDALPSLSFKRQFINMMIPFSELGIHHILSDLTRIGNKRIHLYRGVKLKQPA